MYEPRKPSMRSPFKSSSASYVSTTLPLSSFWQSSGWMSLTTIGTTVVPPSVVPSVFTYMKKLIKYPKTRASFWVNAQCSFLVTSKPLNVRMGKGKGAKVSFYTKISHGVPLAAFSTMSDGLKSSLVSFVSISLGSKVILAHPNLHPSPVEWAQSHSTQTNFLKQSAGEMKELLTFMSKPSLKFFFGKLFSAAWSKPSLSWSYSWPLLPKMSSKLKSRKKKWGTGLKSSAPIWAGLASLFAGVRSVKKKKAKLKKKALALTKKYIFNNLADCLFLKTLPSAKSIKKLKKKGFLLSSKYLSQTHSMSVYLVTSLLSSKNKGLFKLLSLSHLKSTKEVCPKSKMSIPLGYGLSTLSGVWSKFFLNFSQSEKSNLLALGTPSLTCSMKAMGLLESVSLLMSSTPSFLKNTNKVFVGESLFLLKENKGGGDGGFKVVDGSSLVLDYTVQGGFMDLWPSLELSPLVLTKTTLSPFLALYK